MTTDAIHLAVWRNCEKCNGSGTSRPLDAIAIDPSGKRISQVACGACGGQGKRPTFIPLAELGAPTGTPGRTTTPDIIRAIWLWQERFDKAVDQLAAELEASGVVPDVPAPSNPPDQVQLKLSADPEANVMQVGELATAPDFSLPTTALPTVVSREPFAKDSDHLTISGTFQSDKYPWCAAGFVPLKLTDPAARDLLAIYAVRRKPIDAEFSRDLIEALGNVPEKPNPEYGPMPPLQSKPSPDLAVAARKLAGEVDFLSFTQAISEDMNLAMRAVLKCLDGRGVKAEQPDAEKCHHCGGTGKVLFWNGTHRCGDCDGSGVQPVQEGGV